MSRNNLAESLFSFQKSSSFSIVHQSWRDGLWKLNQHLLLQPGLLGPAKECEAFCKKWSLGDVKNCIPASLTPHHNLSEWMVHTHSSQVITTSKSHWVGSRMAIVKVFELVSWIRPMKAAWFLSWEKQGVRKWVWMATYPFYRWNHYSGRWSNLARITQLVKVNIFHRALGRRKLRGAYVTPGRGLAPKGT